MQHSIAPGRLLAFLFALALCFTPAFALGANDVAQANSHLKRAESNLKLVDGSIGHLKSPPKGSAGKLARMRLDSAKPDMDAANKILSGLSSGQGLAEAQQRYANAEALYKKLDGILTGKQPTPKPKPKPKPNPDPDPKPTPTPESKGKDKGKEPAPAPQKPKKVKLRYPHADNFKNSLFSLRRVEGDVNGIIKLWAELKPIKDQLTINYRTSSGAVANIKETQRQAGFVRDGLAKIPANGEGVEEAYARLAEADKTLEQAKAYFEPLNRELLKLVDMANYPAFRADVERLRQLSASYNNPDYLFRDARAKAAVAYKNASAAKDECVRIAQTYRRLIEQNVDSGKHIEATGNAFLQSQARFMDAAEQQKTALPANIRADLAECDKMAASAVAEQKPMWFTGGIPQRMEWVEDKLTLLTSLDPEGAKAVAKEVKAMQASLSERADSLKELIIRQNPLPPDNFRGADREQAIATAIDGWKHQEKEFELLAVRIPAEAWERNTNWSYSNGTWYFNDVSTLQVRLIIADKNNPLQAIDRPINVRKNHQKGDKLIGVPLRSFDEELQPSSYLLRDKIR